MASVEDTKNIHTGSKSQGHITKMVAEGAHKNHHFLGLLFSFGTGLFFAAASICIKRLKYISPSQLTTHCCIAMIFLNLPIIFYKRIAFIYPLKINLFLVARAVFTTIAFNFAYLSIMYIPLADSSVIGSCSPILTTVFARIFLKEPCGILHCICLILTIVGVLLVSKIPLVVATRTIQYGLSYFMGIMFSFVGALGFAMANVVVRFPCLISIHYSISVFYIGAIAVIISAIVTYFIFGFTLPKCGIDRFYMILQALMGGSIEILATKSLQYEEASIAIMVMSTTNIVATFLWQTLVEGITPDAYTSTGAVIVMMCILMIATRRKFTIFLKKIWRKTS